MISYERTDKVSYSEATLIKIVNKLLTYYQLEKLN